MKKYLFSGLTFVMCWLASASIYVAGNGFVVAIGPMSVVLVISTWAYSVLFTVAVFCVIKDAEKGHG